MVKKYRIVDEYVKELVSSMFVNGVEYPLALDKCYEEHKNDGSNAFTIVVEDICSATGVACAIGVLKSDVQEIPKYSPNDWNDFSCIKPPHVGWYCVERHYNCGYVKRRDVCWYDGVVFSPLNGNMNDCQVFFKPW